MTRGSTTFILNNLAWVGWNCFTENLNGFAMIFKGLNTIHRIHFSPWAKGPKIMKVIQMMDHLDFLFKLIDLKKLLKAQTSGCYALY